MCGLSSPIKRHTVAGWIKKQDPTTCCLQETHLGYKDKQVQCDRVEGDTPRKASRESCRSSHTYNRQNRIKMKEVTRHKDAPFIMKKGGNSSIMSCNLVKFTNYSPIDSIGFCT